MITPLGYYILGSFLIALLVALFQYQLWKTNTRHLWVLTCCRALSLALLILLIINPKTVSETSYVVKPKLSLLLDNSKSISQLNKTQAIRTLSERLQGHPELNQKFDLQSYSFGETLSLKDSLDFTAQQTNIGGSLESIKAITSDEIAAVVLLSDGNQTMGRSYVYNASTNTQPVYPLVLGDSTAYVDLSIKQININSYTFLDHSFPVELVLNYKGNTVVKTQLDIVSGSKTIYTKPLTFSPTNATKVLTPYLSAKSPGIQRFTAQLRPLEEEKVKANNFKNFGLEVIDQKFNIALISEVSHPDLAALKAVVTSQKNYDLQRLTPNEFLKRPNDFDLLVLYQPNPTFKKVFEELNRKPINTFLITGTQTDWAFLNSIQSIFKQEITAQTESYQAILNPNFSPFTIQPIAFDNFPPLESSFGQIVINGPHDILLFKTFEGTPTDTPLLLTYKTGTARHVAFFAENIWTWRLRSFQREQSFQAFDAFFGTLIKYLSTQKATDKLKISHDIIFDGSSPLVITAQIFNDNFEPNTTSDLSIEVRSKQLKSPLKFPMLLENTSYRADLSSLEPGRYDYTVQTNSGGLTKSGQFEISPFDIESQFLNANLPMLEQLAEETGGQVFFESQASDLIETLINNDRYKSLQKIDKKAVPLINISIILLLFLLSLSTEWFLRKYFGLI